MADGAHNTRTGSVNKKVGNNTAGNEGEIELESIPGYIGAAVLNLSDGSLSRPCMGKLTEKDTSVLYQILSESGMLLERKTLSDEAKYSKEKLQRITVSFPSVRYAAAVAKDGYIYIIKTKVATSS